jgi:hypothetical protein
MSAAMPDEKKEFIARVYEEQFYKTDSAIASARIIQMNDRAVATIQFKESKNLWNDLTWAPRYDEIAFILKIVYEAEDYNNFVKNLHQEGRDQRETPSLTAYKDMSRIAAMETHQGWLRIGEYEYHLAGSGDELILRRPVKSETSLQPT